VVAARREQSARRGHRHTREGPVLDAVRGASLGKTASAAPGEGAHVGAREDGLRAGGPGDRDGLALRVAAPHHQPAAERAKGLVEVAQ
jgi:hypothetical protein